MARAAAARLRQAATLKARITALLLLSMTMGCVAAPQPITGFYRYGHEVNIVCIGSPEVCYWLVDTTPEVRRQLRQQVSGLAPYTAVCVRLRAEISKQKADGFGLDYAGSIRVLEMLGRCDAQAATPAISLQDLQHRRWVLERIDGMQLGEYARAQGFDGELSALKIPDLDFGDQGFVSGNTGCNQFQGQARVVDNQLILRQLATTAMLCAGFAGALELQLQQAYRNSPDLTIVASDLILRASGRELYFRSRDWVQ
jgi:heat shock protein HslJ